MAWAKDALRDVVQWAEAPWGEAPTQGRWRFKGGGPPLPRIKVEHDVQFPRGVHPAQDGGRGRAKEDDDDDEEEENEERRPSEEGQAWP